jgi:hypothetical protein
MSRSAPRNPRLNPPRMPPAEPHEDPFAFEPVPSASNRRDGWTPGRQFVFIEALRMIGLVSAAAKAAGMSRKSAYKLLERAGPDSGFARAWAEAQAAGETNAYLTAVERAIDGVEVPYFYRGIQRGTRRVYDTRLLLAALRAAERSQNRKD